MGYRYQKHYTVEQAQAMLPQLRQWLERLAELRDRASDFDAQIGAMLASGNDAGGTVVNQWLRTVVDLRSILREFHAREIQLKDIDRGLVDFPAVIGGKEVFLCWEKDEEEIEFWHELDAGYAGREHL